MDSKNSFYFSPTTAYFHWNLLDGTFIIMQVCKSLWLNWKMCDLMCIVSVKKCSVFTLWVTYSVQCQDMTGHTYLPFMEHSVIWTATIYPRFRQSCENENIQNNPEVLHCWVFVICCIQGVILFSGSLLCGLGLKKA